MEVNQPSGRFNCYICQKRERNLHIITDFKRYRVITVNALQQIQVTKDNRHVPFTFTNIIVVLFRKKELT